MSTLPQRQVGIFITLGIVVVGAIVAGVILFTSGKASETELTTANLVPEDASIYAALNTDLTSDQWVAAFKLIERLGQRDPEGELRDSVEETGAVDWEDDVAPFLGGNIAFYLKAATLDTSDVDGAVIIRANDAERAMRVLERQSGFEFRSNEYNGVDYEAAEDTDLFIAIIGDHLVVTNNEESLFDVIDVSKGDRKPISDAQDFKSLRDELTKDFLVFVYINAEQLFEDLVTDDILREAIVQSGASDVAFKPMALVLGASGDAFEFQAASLGESGVASPLLQGRDSRFAGVVPAGAALFASTFGLTQTWDQVRDESGDEIDEYIREQGEYRNLDEALQAAGEEIGIRSVKDIIELLTGETAVAAWFPDGTTDNPEVIFLAEVENEERARELIDRIIASSPDARPRKDRIAGVEVTIVRGDDGEDAAVGVHDGYAFIGTVGAVEATLEAGDDVLAEVDDYKTAKDALDTKTGSFAYFDLATLLRLAEDGIPADLDEAEEALAGLIINLVEERGLIRLAGILTVED